MPIDDERLGVLVAELDAMVPREGALVCERHGLYGSQHDPAYIGNRAGYLRLGIELLKVADAPAAAGRPNRVTADLSYSVSVASKPGEMAMTACEAGELAIFERRDVAAIVRPPGRGSSRRVKEAFGVMVLCLLQYGRARADARRGEAGGRQAGEACCERR
jgi:hypothetical protein